MHKQPLHIPQPHLFHLFTSSTLRGPVYLLQGTTCVTSSLSPCTYPHMSEMSGTIVIRCSLAVRSNGFEEPTNFYVGPISMILWFVSDALNFQPLWPNRYMVWWYRSPVAKGDTFLPSWIKAVTAVPLACYFAILAVCVGGLTEKPLESYAILLWVLTCTSHRVFFLKFLAPKYETLFLSLISNSYQINIYSPHFQIKSQLCNSKIASPCYLAKRSQNCK